MLQGLTYYPPSLRQPPELGSSMTNLQIRKQTQEIHTAL